jgi:hypothetical protein
MTQVALVYTPGNLTVMTAAAVTPVYDVEHLYIVVSGLKMDAKIMMANLACKTNSVEPMREDDGIDACCGGVVIDYHIAVFGIQVRAGGKKQARDEQTTQYLHNYTILTSVMALRFSREIRAWHIKQKPRRAALARS